MTGRIVSENAYSGDDHHRESTRMTRCNQLTRLDPLSSIESHHSELWLNAGKNADSGGNVNVQT